MYKTGQRNIPTRPVSLPVMTESHQERIAKIIAAAGICSRRDAERLIAEGRVAVNGTVLDTPAFLVSPGDRIAVNGRPVNTGKKRVRLWLYHKPAGVMTTHRDPQGRPTVFDSLPRSIGRVISVGRLDLNSEGLLLLTNSGALSRYLEMPKTALPREYSVRVFGHVDPKALADLRHGITVDGVHYGPIEAVQDDPGSRSKNQWLWMILHEGKNREIRNVMRGLDLQVNRLVRTAYGPFELGNLEAGKIREVDEGILQSFLHEIGFEEA